MPYTQDAALDFWYEYDQTFLFEASSEVIGLYRDIYGPTVALDAMVDLVRDHPSDLAARIQGREPSLQRLAAIQLEIMDRHFPEPADLQRAFEAFGQGMLFDDKPLAGNPSQGRRPVGKLIHMMDGNPDDCVGYHRWHAFIRAAVAAGAHPVRWLQINRCVALAWAIYSELNPREDAQDNPPLVPGRLSALRKGWLGAEVETLNQAFLHYTGTFPGGYGVRRAPRLDHARYWHIQKILSNAARGSNPQHSGNRQFWDLPLPEFLRTTVYGAPLLAAQGPGRGANSALVKVLRGTLPGFPRMPLQRDPLTEAEISYIERWIDELETA